MAHDDATRLAFWKAYDRLQHVSLAAGEAGVSKATASRWIADGRPKFAQPPVTVDEATVAEKCLVAASQLLDELPQETATRGKLDLAGAVKILIEKHQQLNGKADETVVVKEMGGVSEQHIDKLIASLFRAEDKDGSETS